MNKYAVLKLMERVEVTNPLTGEVEEVPIGGIDGFIPVFDTEEKALEASCDGKYDIFQIKLQDRHADKNN